MLVLVHSITQHERDCIMPVTIEKTLYQYNELSDRAKSKARDWYEDLTFNDLSDWQCCFDDAARIGELLGISIDSRQWTNSYGFKCSEPKIFFSGFCSQGDGACFEGVYQYKKGALKAIKAETNDATLSNIAARLQDVQARRFYKLRASMRHSGNYMHSGCMSVDVSHCDDNYRDIGSAEEDIRQIMRDFADWIYSQLRTEYEYQTSREAIEEAIRANEYTFNEDGNRED